MRRFSRRLTESAVVLCLCVVILLYIFNQLNIHINYGDVATTKCNCPTVTPLVITQAAQRIEILVEKTTPPLPPLPPCVPVGKDSPVQRAIIIYYPHHQQEYFFPEVRWLYRSWAEMLRSQPPTWRTDFVIFTYNFSAEFRSLGCVNRVRQNKEEPSICRLFIYLPVWLRDKNMTDSNYQHAFDDAKKLAQTYNESIDRMVTIPFLNDPETFDLKRSESLYTNLRSYGYIDSINTLYEGYHAFKMYDFVLRTDIDVFIYRHFATYIPQNCTFITGGGGYGTWFNRRRLARVARAMTFAHTGVSGMGSTWYGSAHDGFLVANQTLHGMLWLAQYEFATPERESRLGTLLWPEWHYGVLLLYGQHLAINHLVGTNRIRLFIGTDLLDQFSTDDNPQFLQQGTRLNFHCWHSNDRFSKFAFKMGHYNRTDLERYRNDTTAQAYSMRMALESKYMTLEQMANLVLKNASST